MALSALETYGKVGNLLAGESMNMSIGEVLSAAQVEQVRSVFVRLLGHDVVGKFEAEGVDDEDSSALWEPSIPGPYTSGDDEKT